MWPALLSKWWFAVHLHSVVRGRLVNGQLANAQLVSTKALQHCTVYTHPALGVKYVGLVLCIGKARIYIRSEHSSFPSWSVSVCVCLHIWFHLVVGLDIDFGIGSL